MSFDNHKKNVKSLYSFFNARWYDPFRRVWNSWVSGKAEKALFDALRKHASTKADILELGCGSGINAARLVKKNLPLHSYLGMDFSDDMLAIAKEKVDDKRFSFQKQDLTTFKSKKKFDIIISTWVLSHLKDQRKIIDKYYKYLKEDGIILLVFLTKPRWYINIWLYPWTRLFATKYVTEEEIVHFPGKANKKTIRRYKAKMVTFVRIDR